MSSNTKRCSSGNTPTTRTQSLASVKQMTTLSRSKTCSFNGITPSKSKPERLQPLPINSNSPLNDEALVNLVFYILNREK
jgi:hypothetical protein